MRLLQEKIPGAELHKEEMNAVTILNTPFVQVALPIIVTFIMAAWLNSKRLDDFRGNFDRRFQQVDKRFEQIDRRFEQMLGDRNQRIVRVEERTSPFGR